ncbi:MAG TPA: response regulator [Fibrobacteria bacterium]|nr:response regulator [Fibrobacteria bacterium]
MKILIADDSGTMRSVQRKILSDLGLKDVVDVADGALALKAAAVAKFDLILLDWNMPNLSGFEALKALKANPATKSIPVIMITSEADKSHILDAVRLGAANYVIKPFTPAVLKEKLALYLPLQAADAPKDGAGKTASGDQAPEPASGDAGKKDS